MTTDEILQLLIAERERLSLAISALQGLTAPKRRGRPPKNSLAAAPARRQKKQGRPRFTKAQRQAQAERMRQYWANRRKQDAKSKKRAKGSKTAAEIPA